MYEVDGTGKMDFYRHSPALCVYSMNTGPQLC